MTAVSFALAAGSIFGLWVVARNPLAGWVWCAAMEVPWCVYAWHLAPTAGYGLLILCAFYLLVYLTNLRKEVRKRDRVPVPRTDREHP